MPLLDADLLLVVLLLMLVELALLRRLDSVGRHRVAVATLLISGADLSATVVALDHDGSGFVRACLSQRPGTTT